jgi:hypothetical protein
MATDSIKMSLQLEGGRELQLKLDALNTKVHQKIVRTAVRDAMQIDLNASKANARGLVGGQMGALLARRLAVRKQKKALPRFVYAMVCLFKGSDLIYISKKGRRSFLPAAIEFGHGRSKAWSAIPFMRQAFASSVSSMIRKLAESLGRGIEQEARK